MELLGTVAVLALVWAVVAASTAALVSAAWRWLDDRISPLHPSDAARLYTIVATAPFVVPSLVVVLCLAPGALGLLGPSVDHCLGHPDHTHLCLVHGRLALTPLLAAWLVVFGVTASVFAARAGLRLLGARRRLAFLEHTRAPRSTAELGLIESPRAFSITAGLLRPRIWLSTALTDALTQQQRAVVEAHERAHVRRRDPLVWLLADWLAAPIPPQVRRSILERLHLASEQACDDAAGIAVSDRVLVAETLLAVARLVDPAPRGAASRGEASFGGSFVSARIERLLDSVESSPRLRPHRWLLASLLVATVLVAPLHHAVEHALGAVGLGR